MDFDINRPTQVLKNKQRTDDLSKNLLVSEAQRAYPGNIQKQTEWMREKIEMDNAYTQQDMDEFASILTHKNIKRMM